MRIARAALLALALRRASPAARRSIRRKPWEKGDLARPSMQFDADPLDAKTMQHIYQSKEGAAGGGTASAAVDVAATESRHRRGRRCGRSGRAASGRPH